MGHLKYIQTNLFNTERPIIFHGVNCSGVFGKGVAKQIAMLYPEAKVAYLKKYYENMWSPGDVQFIETKGGKIIANMATQINYGNDGHLYTNYDACECCFNILLKYCEENKLNAAGPKIGAGLGGGEWSEIEKRLRRAMQQHNVDVDIHFI